MVMLMVIQKQVQLAAQKMVDDGDNYDDYKTAGMTTQKNENKKMNMLILTAMTTQFRKKRR